MNYEYFSSLSKNASVAQLVEQRFCKPSVVGSTPATGSFIDLLKRIWGDTKAANWGRL
jgi:hypothetical protein